MNNLAILNEEEEEDDLLSTDFALFFDWTDDEGADINQYQDQDQHRERRVDAFITHLRKLSHSHPQQFTTNQLFKQQKDTLRFTLYKKMKFLLSIFPSYCFSPTDQLFRESMSARSGEDIEEVTKAINFFWNCRFTFVEEDFFMLRECLMRLAAQPKLRPLWSIVQLKSSFERIRLPRTTLVLRDWIAEMSMELSTLKTVSRGMKRRHTEENRKSEEDEVLKEINRLHCLAEISLNLTRTIHDLVTIREREGD